MLLYTNQSTYKSLVWNFKLCHYVRPKFIYEKVEKMAGIVARRTGIDQILQSLGVRPNLSHSLGAQENGTGLLHLLFFLLSCCER